MKQTLHYIAAISALLISCNISDEDTKRKTTSPRPSGPLDMAQTTEDQRPDTPQPDMTIPPDMDTPQPELGKDYQRCRDSSDCPAGTGECVKSLVVNLTSLPQQIALNQRFTTLGPDEGVCALPCSLSPTACEAIPGSTCQIIYAGIAPTPGDTAAMATGQPFAALCRPPLARRGASFCAPCVGGEDTCDAEMLCVSALTGAQAQPGQAGDCLIACDQSSCPQGFVCEQLGASSYCKPLSRTCGPCLDADADGRGLGHCLASTQEGSPYDCDDTDPRAYFDPARPDHPFPQHCGAQDLNCNGTNDDVEQIGPDRFPTEHCTACFEACDGTVPNGALGCVLVDGAPTCAARCEATHADCDQDPSNGCETPIADPTRQLYPDLDRDGFGDKRASARFACGQDTLPPGTTWVQNNADCDDSNGAINPSALERCDGLDNNCDAQIDEGFQLGTSCTVGSGECRRTGQYICDGAGQARCDAIAGTPSAELCDGRDNDCDGTRDEGFGIGASCTVGASRCANSGHYVCAANNQSAVCNVSPLPSSTEVCDGIDNDCDTKTDEGCPCTSCTNNNLGTASPTQAALIGNDRYWYNNTDGVTKSLNCPANQFIVGLRVRAQAAIDNIEIECNYLDVARNTNATPRYIIKERASSPFKPGLIGNTNTGTQTTLNCTSGAALTSLYSPRGDVPDGALFKFSARCSQVSVMGDNNLEPSAYTISASTTTESKTFGADSGIALPMTSQCPSNKVANGITGYTGRAWVGAVQYPKIVHGLKLSCVAPSFINKL